ncbi:MAG: hypothetical protein FJ206_15975 [Gemmatimonadetes bacterium]|nr:hypothetical protein [Gemmatimonadota bacterium]
MTDNSAEGVIRRIQWARRVLGIERLPDAPGRRPSGDRDVPADERGTEDPGDTCAGRVARVALVIVALGSIGATLGEAQDERRLKQVFEGKRVTALLDLPATSEGVDIFPGSSRPLDFQKYSARLKNSGVAIKEGERSIITKIRVKDDVIEVQLGGGGYGTFGDVFNSALSTNGADSGAAQQLKVSNERTQRLASGSRFNLRYPNGITPDDLEPEAIVKALSEYATFPTGVAGKAGPTGTTAQAAAPPAANPPAVREPQKGMTAAELERVAGAASSVSKNGPVETRLYAEYEADLVNEVVVDVRKRAAGGATIRKGMSPEEVEAMAGKPIATKTAGQMTTHTYKWQGGTLEADFYNGVLVGYRISSGE